MHAVEADSASVLLMVTPHRPIPQPHKSPGHRETNTGRLSLGQSAGCQDSGAGCGASNMIPEAIRKRDLATQTKINSLEDFAPRALGQNTCPPRCMAFVKPGVQRSCDHISGIGNGGAGGGNRTLTGGEAHRILSPKLTRLGADRRFSEEFWHLTPPGTPDAAKMVSATVSGLCIAK